MVRFGARQGTESVRLMYWTMSKDNGLEVGRAINTYATE